MLSSLSQDGGAKRRRRSSTTKKPAAAKKSVKKGGDALSQNLTGLAVPFAFLLAKHGLEALKKKDSKKPAGSEAAKKKTSKGKKRGMRGGIDIPGMGPDDNTIRQVEDMIASLEKSQEPSDMRLKQKLQLQLQKYRTISKNIEVLKERTNELPGNVTNARGAAAATDEAARQAQQDLQAKENRINEADKLLNDNKQEMTNLQKELLKALAEINQRKEPSPTGGKRRTLKKH